MLRNKLRLYVLNNQRSLKTAIEEIDSFNGDRVVTREGIPNINVGGVKLREFIDNYFFPPIPPLLVISVVPGIKEYGDFTNAEVHWSVTKKTKGIKRITVDTAELAPDYPDSLIDEDTDAPDATNSGTLLLPVYLPDNAMAYAFFMYARDTLDNVFSASATLHFLHRRLWFSTTTDLVSLGDTELSDFLNASVGAVGNPPYPIGSELAATRVQERVVTCYNQYLCFLWPADFGGDNGDFNVNTFDVNLWQIKDITYTNIFGFSWPFRLVQSWYKLYGTYDIQVKP